MHTKWTEDELRSYATLPCSTPDDLWEWLRLYLGLWMPRKAVCPDHQSPFDYLTCAYFEPTKDQVVWAPRGGGKTRLGAVATLLDLLHKPGIQVRILGGSMEQSLKMWEYLTPDLERLELDFLTRELRGRSVKLRNRSRAAVIPQSERAVRGLRINKLRCDEVELFEPQIWQAAQLTVQSAVVAGPRRMLDHPIRTDVRGTVEAMSTHHKPWGMMRKIVDDAQRFRTRVVKWCILDVLERCPPERDCNGCPLWDECRGVAKTACDGFYSIDDACAMKRRVSEQCWQSEMLCRRPSQEGRVFPSFARDLHVRKELGGSTDTSAEMAWAIDFGFRAPFVCLWIATRDDGRAHVVDEYVQPERTVAEHLAAMEARTQWARPAWIGCDPAGAATNEQTAQSNLALLRERRYAVRSRPSKIVEGLELIRAALKPAHGEATLFVHPRCARLIRALESYHYAPNSRGELPEKDGEHDHLIDALRYHYVNRGRGKAYGQRAY